MTSSPPSSVLSTAVYLECSCVATKYKGCARCGISIYTLVDMQQSIDRLTEHTAAVRQQVEKEGAATAQRQCEELMAEWNGMEPRFLLYVRHDHLDNIMEHLSELPAYCLEDDRAELLSTLDAALRMMEHLKESITPSCRTLL